MIGLVIVVAGGALNNHGQKVTSLLKDSYAATEQLETYFANAYYNKITVSQVFTPEVHEELNSDIATLTRLQVTLANIKPSRLNSKAQQNFELLQSQLNTRTLAYQDSITLYNAIYDAYINNNPNSLTSLLANNNYYANLAIERFYDYLTKQKSLWAEIENNDCNTERIDSELCSQDLEMYFDNLTSLSSNTLVVAAIFTAYYDGPYDNDNLLITQINALLEEIQ